MDDWHCPLVEVSRFQHGSANAGIFGRTRSYAAWHFRVAAALSRWKPDVVIAVEPHSNLAVWLYYTVFRGKAQLLVHHHEYYAPEDFSQPGMRLLVAVNRLERDALLERAIWVSQTNATRLRLMLDTHPRMRASSAQVLPNYPPRSWIDSAGSAHASKAIGRTRLVYVGAAAFADTFIREITEWVMKRPRDFSLHVAGNNFSPEVTSWLGTLDSENITVEPDGYPYKTLPDVLTGFDAGLILYKGNTLNFVHNVPNKTFEYLGCGLEVWYPPEMKSMRDFHRDFPGQRLREVNFRDLPSHLEPSHNSPVANFPFSCELALAPMIAMIQRQAAPT